MHKYELVETYFGYFIAAFLVNKQVICTGEAALSMSCFSRVFCLDADADQVLLSRSCTPGG